ncbi:hypothetical protein HNQ64_000775 [Prosthecobacter dejongeii]|uniref:Uncharacterized protein n=1 Tax=Prosthecobacter dejongeii TaxID=48465 RepID=A0A7W7YI02_9BACT|nr:hypothetical protein [Prosthecobacter dejongeii]
MRLMTKHILLRFNSLTLVVVAFGYKATPSIHQ